MSTYTATRSSIQNPKTAFLLTMLLVFLAGAVAGALAMNFGAHKGFHRAAFWTDPGKDLSLRKLQRELDLTPAQTDQLKTVLDDFSRYYQDVLSTGKTSIYKILTPEQRRKFDGMVNEAQERR